jgi:N-acetylmuramoyl-L-alanine amidase
MELQRRLNALGFDAGREDGILGPDTERAVRQFQRNAGIASDAICGPETRAALERLGALAAGSVASVREREHLRRGARLAGSRIFLAADPGLEPLAADVARELQARGAVVTVDACGADDGAVAAAANDAGADLFVAFAARGECTLQVAYFANPTFQSEGGRRVAAAVAAALHAVDSAVPDLPVGRTFRLLRETRMAAVVCELAEGGDDPSLAAVAGRRAEFAAAFVAGISRGIEAPKPG